jgi:transcriptional regulator with XRE-family HTH domain
MTDERRLLLDELRDEEARHLYAEDFGNSAIALQIKALRLQRGWTQRELAERAGLKQSQVSAMEQADHDTWTLKTLRKLARAFDLALNVRFESFGWLVDDVLGCDREALERPSFEEGSGTAPKAPGS